MRDRGGDGERKSKGEGEKRVQEGQRKGEQKGERKRRDALGSACKESEGGGRGRRTGVETECTGR